MNKTELTTVFELMEPTDIQKDNMLQQIIYANKPIKLKKHIGLNRILKIAASFVLILCLVGTTAYASGLLDKVLGYYSIENNFVSWTTNEDLLMNSNDTVQDVPILKYDETYTYDTIEEALQKHNLNIAIPTSQLLPNTLNKISVNISNANPDILDINFNAIYDLSTGTVELNVYCYKSSSNNYSVSTSQHADKASKYISKSDAVFTLLEANVSGDTHTVANIMINADNNQSYLYSLQFTNFAKADIENILDSLDMSIYVTEY